MAKKKPSSEDKDLLQLGQKQRAGALLSGYLRAIGTEVDQVIMEDTIPGCTPGMPKLVSKAEALARHIWKMALPYKDDAGKLHPPTLAYVQIVLERIEGKTGMVAEEKETGRETVPDKISRINAERVNKISAEVMGE